MGSGADSATGRRDGMKQGVRAGRTYGGRCPARGEGWHGGPGGRRTGADARVAGDPRVVGGGGRVRGDETGGLRGVALVGAGGAGGAASRGGGGGQGAGGPPCGVPVRERGGAAADRRALPALHADRGGERRLGAGAGGLVRCSARAAGGGHAGAGSGGGGRGA